MSQSADFVELWREALQKWERQTNEALNAASADENVSRVMSQSLAAIAKLQAKQGEAIERELVRYNLPSRADFRELAARLDGIESQLGELRDLLRAAVASPQAEPSPAPPRPARTRKPPQPDSAG
jgi:polyhydroxyalkanoate synthesis regulator phasin